MERDILKMQPRTLPGSPPQADERTAAQISSPDDASDFECIGQPAAELENNYGGGVGGLLMRQRKGGL